MAEITYCLYFSGYARPPSFSSHYSISFKWAGETSRARDAKLTVNGATSISISALAFSPYLTLSTHSSLSLLSLSLSGNSFLLSAFVAAFEIFHCILLCGCIFVALRQFVVQFISESSSAGGSGGRKGRKQSRERGENKVRRIGSKWRQWNL